MPFFSYFSNFPLSTLFCVFFVLHVVIFYFFRWFMVFPFLFSFLVFRSGYFPGGILAMFCYIFFCFGISAAHVFFFSLLFQWIYFFLP